MKHYFYYQILLKEGVKRLRMNEKDNAEGEKTLSEILNTNNPTSPVNLIQYTTSANSHIPSVSASAVLGESYSMPEGTPIVRGYDFSSSQSPSSDNDNDNGDSKVSSSQSPSPRPNRILLDDILQSYSTMGFQASNVALAIEQIKAMRKWRLSDIPYQPNVEDESLEPLAVREKIRARIFFSYTSNQISCGQREIIRYLVQNKMVDVIVTTAGGIEEDLMKCFEHTYMGDFKLPGKELRKKGINRIGNLLVPNKNYCKFEDWMSPLIEKMNDEQDEAHRIWAKEVASLSQTGEPDLPERFVWTPSKFIERLGIEIDDESSVLYWAAKNKIPVFCPALTDGSVGDMLYFHSYKRKGFILDINEDIRRINDLAVQSHATGQIIIGGGLVKHHTCNANLMRNGANYSVYINTGQEFDGSDSGASPDEAISWGKIRIDAKPVKVSCDATIVWPLIVSQTFAKDVEEWKESCKNTVCWL